MLSPVPEQVPDSVPRRAPTARRLIVVLAVALAVFLALLIAVNPRFRCTVTLGDWRGEAMLPPLPVMNEAGELVTPERGEPHCEY